jgi:hypothetical protein
MTQIGRSTVPRIGIGDTCDRTPRLRGIALNEREPFTHQGAVFLFELDAEIASPGDLCRDQGATGPDKGIEQNLSSLKFFGSRTSSKKKTLPAGASNWGVALQE